VRLPTGQAAQTLVAVRAARPAQTGLVVASEAASARQVAGLLAARGRRYDALAGTDLRDLELLSGYRTLVAPAGALSARAASAYRATGGRLVSAGAAGRLTR
jgi:hypothetical protein